MIAALKARIKRYWPALRLRTILFGTLLFTAALPGAGALFLRVYENTLVRQTETEADLLGMHLLRNAGYDPQLAVTFWRDHGGDVDGGLFRSRTHPSSKARAQAIADEIARIPAGSGRPYSPPLLASRDQPLQ